MKNSIFILFFFVIAIFLVGCSGSMNPMVPSGIDPTGLQSPENNPFKGYPVDMPYGEYTQQGISFSIDSSGTLQRTSTATGNVNSNAIAVLDSASIDKSSMDSLIKMKIQNKASTIFDAFLVVDQILPAGSQALDNDGVTTDGKPYWNYGIIPSNKTSPERALKVRFSGMQEIAVIAHLEFKTRPFIQTDNISLHTDGFNEKAIRQSSIYGEIVSNEVISGIPTGEKIGDVYEYLSTHALIPVGFDTVTGSMELRILDGRDPEDVISELKSDGFLPKPEPNSIFTMDYFPNDPPYNPSLPDDFRWAFDRIDAVNAWDIFSDGLINNNGNARVAFGTVLAIVDTGLIKHEDFNLNTTDNWVWDNYGKNFINTANPPIDDVGHGTRAAGVAAAMGDNAKGLAGVAWDPIFLPIKSLGADGKGSGYSIELGLAYLGDLAAQFNWIKMPINMGFGKYSQDPANDLFHLGLAVNYVNSRPNTLMVAAAGNHKNDKNFAFEFFDISADNRYPAAYPACMSIGASSRLQYLGQDKEVFQEDPSNWGTNWGSTVAMCAPGSLSILTTDKDAVNDYVTNWGGTSASTAFVTGACALLWTKFPAASKSQIRDQLKHTADPMYLPADKIGKLGSGRLNLYRSLTMEFGWTHTFGSKYYDEGRSVVTDPDGNVYVTGFFDNKVDLDPGPGVDVHTTTGFTDVFLCKFGPSGNYLWGRTWGKTYYDGGDSVAIDSTGNVYVGGIYDKLEGPDEAFIRKYSKSGNLDWERVWFGIEHTYVNVDERNDIVVTGGFVETVDFNPDPAPGQEAVRESLGMSDVFLSKFANNGDFKWVLTWGGTDWDTAFGVDFDDLENIYVIGTFRDPYDDGTPVEVDFNPSDTADLIKASNGYDDIFMSKFNKDGNFQWVDVWGGIGTDVARGISVDEFNNVHVTGYFMDTVDFDPGFGTDEKTSNGSSDIFLSKFGSTGALDWVKTWGGIYDDYAYSVAVDSNQRTYVTGVFQAEVDFDTTQTEHFRTAKSGDIFISRFSSAGNWQKVYTIGDTGWDKGMGVAIDMNNAVLLTGSYFGRVDFDLSDLTDYRTSVGYSDIFVKKIPASLF